MRRAPPSGRARAPACTIHPRTNADPRRGADICAVCGAIVFSAKPNAEGRLVKWAVWVPATLGRLGHALMDDHRHLVVFWRYDRARIEEVAGRVGGKVVDAEWMCANLEALQRGEVQP